MQKARNIRASWNDYGITPERLEKLQQFVREGSHDNMIRSLACMADKYAAEHILLSIKKGCSYERLECCNELGRCPLGRTNFYGTRRLFFHYLDIALKVYAESKVSVNRKGYSTGKKMDELRAIILGQTIDERLRERKDDLQEELFKDCKETDSAEVVYSKMILNGISIATKIAAGMALDMLLKAGVLESLSEDDLRRKILSVVKPDNRNSND